MENLTNLAGSNLIAKLEDMIAKKSVAIIEYKDVFREVYPLEVKMGKLWVYQKSDNASDKKEGIRQMFLGDIILWEVVKERVNLETWKLELMEIERDNQAFATSMS